MRLVKDGAGWQIHDVSETDRLTLQLNLQYQEYALESRVAVAEYLRSVTRLAEIRRMIQELIPPDEDNGNQEDGEG